MADGIPRRLNLHRSDLVRCFAIPRSVEFGVVSRKERVGEHQADGDTAVNS